MGWKERRLQGNAISLLDPTLVQIRFLWDKCSKVEIQFLWDGGDNYFKNHINLFLKFYVNSLLNLRILQNLFLSLSLKNDLKMCNCAWVIRQTATVRFHNRASASLLSVLASSDLYHFAAI